MPINLNILHVDMDAFFASIEQRDNIGLKGLPVIISGNINKRSVVSTCSYEARKYGIKSSLATKTAYKLCPNGIFIYPRFEYYKKISGQIRNILLDFTDKVEMFSLDEAYLDISENKLKIKNPTDIALKIKERINKVLNLTCSIGVSFNKFLAKIGSDYKKPNGITVINEYNFEKIIDNLEINKIFGIGEVTSNRLKKVGIKTGKDLKSLSKEFLFKNFGVRGITLFNNIRGIGDSEIIVNRVQKSFSKEVTLDRDIEINDVLNILKDRALDIKNLMNNNGIFCKTITLKIKFHDFSYVNKQITCRNIISKYEEIVFILTWLKNRINSDKKVRLIGVKISNIIKENEIIGTQSVLFEM